MGQLMQNSPTRAGKRLLLVLTDGLPMDDHAMATAAAMLVASSLEEA